MWLQCDIRWGLRGTEITLENCKIKKARFSDDLEIIVKPSTKISASPKKLDISKVSQSTANHHISASLYKLLWYKSIVPWLLKCVGLHCPRAYHVLPRAAHASSKVHDSPWVVQIPHTSKAMVQLLHICYYLLHMAEWNNIMVSYFTSNVTVFSWAEGEWKYSIRVKWLHIPLWVCNKGFITHFSQFWCITTQDIIHRRRVGLLW